MAKIGISERVLREKMEKAGIKRYVDLAEKAGVTDRTIYSTLHDGNFRVGTLAALASALRTDPRDLLEVEDE